MLSLLLVSVCCLSAFAAGHDDPQGSSTEPDGSGPVATQPLPTPPEQVIAEARAASERLDWETAIMLLQGLLARASKGEEVSADLRAQVMLELGVLQYRVGDRSTSRETLGTLLATPRSLLPWEVWAEAKVYVAELYYEEGRHEEGDASLRDVLEENEQAQISPYVHSELVYARFLLVREALFADMQQRAETERRPLPWWGYAPFGVPQFQQGQPARGAAYAILQSGFIGLSIGSRVWITRLEAEGGGDHRNDSDEEKAEATRQITLARQLRSGLNVPAASAFYLTWGASALDGGMSWRRRQRLEIGVGFVPQPDGATVMVGGRF